MNPSKLIQVTKQIASQIVQIIVFKMNKLKLMIILKYVIWKILQIIISEI